MTKPPSIREFLQRPMSGPAIEARSFELIDRERQDGGRLSAPQWTIVRRMIHACGDPSLAAAVHFSSDAIEAGVQALRRGAALYVDSAMIRSGLSLARLRQACAAYSREQIFCHVADADVARQAEESGLPRSLFALRKACAALADGIAVIGNAPIALLELNRLVIEEGLRPALVLAMPVGFVHVIESKEELMAQPVPFVTVTGRRGGSALAVAAVHAFCTLTEERNRAKGGESE
ncbi:MAG TPA: precorrin-8X methylmutase [Candidatus Sulfotelmatobacter sp.]|nr:precorrin-8X methylmutase [Candidatus Sulfotelmatobacter sp.]